MDLKKELLSDMPMTIRLMEAVAGLKSKKNDGDTVNHGANAVKKQGSRHIDKERKFLH